MSVAARLAASAGRPLDLVGVGEAMVELFADGPLGTAATLRRAYGGDVLNTLVAAARAGCATGFVSRVGDDPFGPALRAAWRAEGVDLSSCPLVEGINGVYFISLDADGEREFTYRRAGSAAAALRPDHLDAGYLASARVVLLSGITQAISRSAQAATLAAARIARSAGAVVAYDVNHRPRLWADLAATEGRGAGDGTRLARAACAELLPYVDVLLVSEPGDLAALGDGPAERVMDAVASGHELVVRKLGAEGCAIRGGRSWRHVPPVSPAAVVDSTGAGDAWNAGFLGALLDGRDPAEAAARGNEVAARNLGHRGAIAPRPA